MMKNLLCVLALLGVGHVIRAEVAIADKGQPNCVVVAGADCRTQAEIMRNYLARITGASLPVVNNPAEVPAGQSAIILELVKKVPGASDKPNGRQAYRIKTEGNRLTLTASSDLGLTYAVYGFLEDHLGCRFYTYKAKGLTYGGSGYEMVPKQATLTLGKLDDFQEPVFAQRGFIFWPGSYPWILQNRGGGLPSDTISGALASGHNFYDLLPPQDKKDGKGNVIRQGYFTQHPEWYPLNHEGKRETPWNMGLCATNPELPKALADALREEIAKRKKHPGKGQTYDPSFPIPAAQGDGFTGCQCAACRNLVREEQSEAAPLILMLNRALDELVKTDPDQQVITFAYFESLDAPKTLKPHKNLWINVVSSAKSQNMAGDQVGSIVGNPANRDYAKALKAWPKIAPNRVTTWHWVPYQPEWPAIFYLGDIMKYWQDCGIYGTNPQLCGDNWQWLYAWVYLKLAWNPKQDADKLIHQFLEDNYGKGAAPHVWEYLKLAQAAYADSGHVPSAVRWSGWTATTRVKMFPPSVLAKMTAAMDKALAAAEKEGDPARLANMIEARGNSIDAVTLNAASSSGRPWGPIKNPRDGRKWFVAGADPLVPGCLERVKKATSMNGGGEHGVLRTISWYVANQGGPLVELESKEMSVSVCPDLKGQITAVTDRKTGKDLLAVQGGQAGYLDVFDKVSSQIWLPLDIAKNDLNTRGIQDKDWSSIWSEFQNPAKDRLETDLTLSASYYGFDAKRHLLRTVSVNDAGIKIERKYSGTPDNPNRFTTRWLLALPNPALAKVAVKGGGIAKVLDLKYAVPGGIKGVKAGERLPGADDMDQKFDDVVAISDAEAVKLPVTANAAGEIIIQLDRGDGVAAVLTTPVSGWEAIELKPVVDLKYLEVKLIGSPADKSATAIDLPVQSLAAKTVPAAKPVAATAPAAETAQPLVAKIRITGSTTAINEMDGAELVWVPAGEFLRGSPTGKGAADERPQKKIYLDGYWIYKTPVTLAQYKKFSDAAGKKFEPTWGQGMHAEPKGDDGAYAAQMSWYEADAYAKAMGAALPTEAQWEKAARGTDGREYPWGNEWDPKKCVSMEETLYKFSSGFRPVGSYPAGASPYGVLDMAGNVWEWVADWYDGEYYGTAPDKNPAGPALGTHKVLRGGCSLYDERLSRCVARFINPPHVRDWTPTGFRCVVNAPGPKQ
jgi:formylglycine-generating enzyme required for sulfatase activity